MLTEAGDLGDHVCGGGSRLGEDDPPLSFAADRDVVYVSLRQDDHGGAASLFKARERFRFVPRGIDTEEALHVGLRLHGADRNAAEQ